MGKYKFFIIAFFTLFFSSCDKKTENMSRSTYYTAFEIQGNNPAIVQVGEPYVDAGAIASEHGKDVTSGMEVVSNVNADSMGMYKVEYSHVNIDGLKSRAIREVIVCNPGVTTDLSGMWRSQPGSWRILNSGAQTFYENYFVQGRSPFDYQSPVTYLAPGFFHVNDFLGGWHAGTQAIHPQVHRLVMSGYFALNEDNTISMISGYLPGVNFAWNSEMEKLENGRYNPETGEITWDVYHEIFSGGRINKFVYHVILKK